LARRLWKYDARGHVIEEAFYGLDGKLKANKSGVARISRLYQANGQQIKEQLFGPDGKPIPKARKAAR
jgi:hypothetical protein